MNEIFPGRGFLRAIIIQIAMLVVGIPARASIITWGAAQNISADSNVSTAGTLVGGLNLGEVGVGNTVVNGVTFTGLPITSNSVTLGNFNVAGPLGASNSVYSTGPFGLSASYETLISSMVFSFGQPITLTMSSLVPGAGYQFQWWSNANEGSGSNTTATAGNSVDLVSTAGSYGPALWSPGQFATGTFIADATAVQTITFSSGFFVEINAFQLRQISPVPDDDSTFALFALGLLGLSIIGRKVRSLQRT
jgi:hypothetical protein